MNSCVPDWKSLVIHESSPGTKNSEFIMGHCKEYSYSHFYPGVEYGTYKASGRCENLEQLTFGDNSFDVFITQDVFEHINQPEEAFAEIARVLKPDGVHVFTVPLYKDLKKSRPRIKLEDGRITHLFEPVYHGNPVSKDGSLVTWDYGNDLPEFIFKCSKLFTTVYFIKNRDAGIDGEFIEVFISKKVI